MGTIRKRVEPYAYEVVGALKMLLLIEVLRFPVIQSFILINMVYFFMILFHTVTYDMKWSDLSVGIRAYAADLQRLALNITIVSIMVEIVVERLLEALTTQSYEVTPQVVGQQA